MILRSIRVESWRCLGEPVLLEGLDPGFNLIHGPNEAGKSTLLDAICRGFYDRHGAGGAAIAARQPWGTTLGPTVTIEFELGEGERFRLHKRFFESPRCELYQWIDGRMQKVARDRNADDRILELLGATPAGRGLSKPEHWGLGQVLWARHGEGETLAAGDSQQARLREALRITLDTARGEAIERELRRRHQAVFTDRGKLRARAEVTTLAEQLARAEQQSDELQAALDALEQTTAELVAAEAGQRDLRALRERTREGLRQERRQLEGLARQQQGFDQTEAVAEQATATWRQLDRRCRRLAEVDEVAGRAQAEQQRLRAVVDGQGLAVDDALAAREQRLREAEAGRQRLAEAERALRWLRCNRDLERAGAELELQRETTTRAEAVRAELARLEAPTREQLRELRQLDAERRATRAQLEATSLSVSIEPEGALALQAEIDGARESVRQLSRPLTLRAASSLTLEIHGVGRIVVRGGESDAAALAERLERLEARWADRRGVDDLATLEDRSSRRAELEAQLAALQRRIDEHPPLAALEQRLNGLDEQRRALLDRGESLTFCWDSFDRVHGEREVAVRELGSRERALEATRATLESARQALSEARQQHARALATLEAHQAEGQRLRREDGLADGDRRAELDRARQRMEQATAALSATEQPGQVALRREVGRRERQLAEQEQQLAEGQRRIGSLARDVERAGGEGLYSQLAVAVERRESLRQRLAQARVDAEGIRLLCETLEEAKRGMLEALLEPVRERVNAGLAELVGPRYGGVSFDRTLAPAALERAEGEPAAVADLSHGTRGQLMLLTRLALAELLGLGGERQCVIVEDPLASSDPERQAAAVKLLERAAERCQILVLSCQPDAYAGLQRARRFDLGRAACAPPAGERADRVP